MEGQSPLRAAMLAHLELLEESVRLAWEQLISLAVPLCSAPDAGDHPEWGSPLVLLLAETWHAHLGQKCFSGRQLQQLGQGCPTWSTGGAPHHLPQTCSPNDPEALLTPGMAGTRASSLLLTAALIWQGKAPVNLSPSSVFHLHMKDLSRKFQGRSHLSNLEKHRSL